MGNLLDQAYFKDDDGLLECTAEVHSKYYTDHKGLAIIVKQGMIIYKLETFKYSHNSGNDQETGNITWRNLLPTFGQGRRTSASE